MSFQPLTEIRVTDPADLKRVVLFHDADFVANEITFDEARSLVEIVFDQDVRDLPAEPALPPVHREPSGVLRLPTRFVPFVECHLRVRQARGFVLHGDMDWGMLNNARFDRLEGKIVIESVIGPEIHIDVEGFDVEVAISDRIRAYRRLRTLGRAEWLGKRVARAIPK